LLLTRSALPSPRRLLPIVIWSGLFILYLPFFSNNRVTHALEYNALGFATAITYYYFNARVLIPRLYETGRYVAFVAALVGSGLALTGLRLLVEYVLLHDEILRAFPGRHRYHLYSVTSMMVVALVSSFSQIVRNRRQAEAQAREIIARQQESQLLYLRAQINPHFLFNTLNNIYALALARSADTPEMVLRLSSLLRYAIYSTSQHLVTVSEEVTQIEELLALYRLRCAGPVDLRLSVDDGARQVRLEPMLLIPLVENCLKHGDVEYNPEGYVHLRLSREGDELLFEARNTTDTTSPAPAAPSGSAEGVASHGVGLANIRRRLELTYPPGAARLLTDRQGNVFTAALHLPVQL